jgi:hypothetical protein
MGRAAERIAAESAKPPAQKPRLAAPAAVWALVGAALLLAAVLAIR